LTICSLVSWFLLLAVHYAVCAVDVDWSAWWTSSSAALEEIVKRCLKGFIPGADRALFLLNEILSGPTDLTARFNTASPTGP
jgi:hypothetical protein